MTVNCRLMLFFFLGIVVVSLIGFTGKKMETADQVTTIATLPESVVELWPGNDNRLLAQTKKHIFELSITGGEEKEVISLDEQISSLPMSDIGWQPTRLAIVSRELGRPIYSLRIIRPEPEHTFPVPSVYKIDLCTEAGLILCHTMDAEGLLPGPLQVLNLQGQPIPQWKENAQGFFIADATQSDQEWVVAIALTNEESPICWLLTSKGTIRWKKALDPGWVIKQVRIAGSAKRVILSLHNYATEESQIIFLSLDDGTQKARVQIPAWSGRHLELSPNGRWLTFSGECLIGLVDVTKPGVLWHTLYGKDLDYWFQYVDVNDQGIIAAAFTDHAVPGPIELLLLDNTGKVTPLWESPKSVDYASLPRGRSVFWTGDGHTIILRYGNDVVAINAAEK